MFESVVFLAEGLLLLQALFHGRVGWGAGGGGADVGGRGKGCGRCEGVALWDPGLHV